MKNLIKDCLEKTPIAMFYRTLRDEWSFHSCRTVKTSRGYSFRGRSDMATFSFETVEVMLWEKYLRDSDVFVDVGANVGYFTCLACSMGKRTIAIEPLESNLRYLYANIEMNGWSDLVEVFPVGLSDSPKLTTLFGGGTGASLLEGWAGTSAAFRRSISVSTLDILIGDRFKGKRIAIKMDIEGGEYSALQGAMKLLKASPRPVWLVEITLDTNRQCIGLNPCFINTFKLFWENGYSAHSVSHPQVQIEPGVIIDYAKTGNKARYISDNYIFKV